MTALPEWRLPITPTLVVSTAIATRDFQDVHHDRHLAQSYGSQDIFLNILTTTGLVQRYVTDSLGDVELAGIALRLGAPAYPGDELVFSGTRDGDTVTVLGRVELGDHVTATVTLRSPVVEEVAQQPSRDPWTPKLVALDIDGTLVEWIQGGEGLTRERVRPRVAEAVTAAARAGAHVVLASGRSAHGMTRIVEMLGLDELVAEPLWVVASNGAVVFRYPPLEIVYEETFDAGPAVRAILAARPTARVAVEERGVGYRVSTPFPAGELSGEMITTDVETMVAEPVSRVVIRDPDATAEEFVDLVAGLGLHGTDYVVGWTAWLDLNPIGVSKASGLQRVAVELGLSASDALAIGDGRNDLEMLAWAARGVAMGQALQEVIDAADDVTASVAEDGVAEELERYCW